ncbi:MAG: ammonia-dependent NAD(+) synthetase [Propionibacteriaceae bacterium]
MTDKALQEKIRTELEVVRDFDVKHEVERRISFLADYLTHTGCAGYVLGISGGVDSSVGGRLAQLACERVRTSGAQATFVAMRLPYGTQADEADAQRALTFIQPDETLTVNIKPAVDGMWDQLEHAGLVVADPSKEDFVRGNVKARERMIAQFTVAGARNMLVVGTDQAAEALVGFYTKFGDGAADLTPLTGLPKRRVKEIARFLGAEERVVEKVPTADLEDNKPLVADEVALGVAYHDVDAYLEGEEVSAEAETTILRWYRRTAHKRALPVTPAGWESKQK